MDYPFLVGFVVLAIVWAIGAAVERFHVWAKPAAVLATIALLLQSALWLAAR